MSRPEWLREWAQGAGRGDWWAPGFWAAIYILLWVSCPPASQASFGKPRPQAETQPRPDPPDTGFVRCSDARDGPAGAGVGGSG